MNFVVVELAETEFHAIAVLQYPISALNDIIGDRSQGVSLNSLESSKSAWVWNCGPTLSHRLFLLFSLPSYGVERKVDNFLEIFFFLGLILRPVKGPGCGDHNLALGKLCVRSVDFLLTVVKLRVLSHVLVNSWTSLRKVKRGP